MKRMWVMAGLVVLAAGACAAPRGPSPAAPASSVVLEEVGGSPREDVPSALDRIDDPALPAPLVDPARVVSGGPPPDGIPPSTSHARRSGRQPEVTVLAVGDARSVHDLGGGVAQIAAVHEPGRFAGIVLTNAVCYDSWPSPSVKAMQRAAPVLRYLPEVALYPNFVRLVHRGHDNRARALESIGVHWPYYVTHGAARSLMRQVSALDVRDTLAVADRLPGLGLPARVVWGVADQFQKVDYGRRLAGDLGTDLRPIPGGKHFTPEDHPEAIADAINDLLLSISTTSQRN